MTSVALVVTVRDEAGTIAPLLGSIDAQTRAPDEVVVVDGGSIDGTLDELERWAATRPAATVARVPGANIAAGRNAAISRTTAEIVAVTDGGCVLEPDWLANLVGGLGAADVAMGYYVPLTNTFFERVATSLTVPDDSEIVAERFMPSSRSVAFRREVWERVGGYPEWLDVGEDMYFNFRLLDAGVARVFVPDAVVAWRPRSTLRAFVRQYYRYAKGDGQAGMYPRRHAIRFVAYAIGAVLVAASLVWWTTIVVLPGAAAGAWLAPAYRRAWRRMRARALVAFLVLLPLAAAMDVAKMAGYLAGRASRKRKP